MPRVPGHQVNGLPEVETKGDAVLCYGKTGQLIGGKVFLFDLVCGGWAGGWGNYLFFQVNRTYKVEAGTNNIVFKFWGHDKIPLLGE